MLEHLKLFLGTAEQRLDHYMIRFLPGNQCQFIATNGYALAVNTLPVIHAAPCLTIAVSPAEFTKILLFENALMEFSGGMPFNMVVGANGVNVPLTTLYPSKIPNIDKILSLSPVDSPVDVNFSTKNFKLIAEYCRLIGATEFTQKFTGEGLPTIISGNGGSWEIYLMPLGE